MNNSLPKASVLIEYGTLRSLDFPHLEKNQNAMERFARGKFTPYFLLIPIKPMKFKHHFHRTKEALIRQGISREML